jgi:hypothetical protein
LQFKRLLQNNNLLKYYRNYVWIAPFLAVGAIASCAVSDDNSNGDSLSISKAVRFLTGTDPGITVMDVNGKSTLMTFSSNHCEEATEDEKTIKLSLHTSFGAKEANFIFSPDKNQIVELFVDSQSQGYIDEQVFLETQSLLVELCSSNANVDRFSYEQTAKLVNSFTDAVSKVSPNCNIEKIDNKFRCKFGNIQLSSLSNELKQINKNILKKVKRPPYILMRKLSFSRQLAKAIEKEDLTDICALTSYSLKEETPIVMKTASWTQGICSNKPNQESLNLSIEALRIAKNELKALESLALKNSSRGIVSIRLPKSLTKGQRNLFVELSPSTKVYKEITDSQTFQALPENTGFCWHPIASDNSPAGQSLYSLGFLKTSEALCMHSAEGYSNGVKELAASITGDANFVVSNYRGKLLRLPRGEYEYRISTLPSDPRAAPLGSGTVIKTGTLSWSGRRYTTIK